MDFGREFWRGIGSYSPASCASCSYLKRIYFKICEAKLDFALILSRIASCLFETVAQVELKFTFNTDASTDVSLLAKFSHSGSAVYNKCSLSTMSAYLCFGYHLLVFIKSLSNRSTLSVQNVVLSVVITFHFCCYLNICKILDRAGHFKRSAGKHFVVTFK